MCKSELISIPVAITTALQCSSCTYMQTSINTAISTLRNGRLVLLIDDTDPNSAGYVLCPAASTTAEQISFIANFSRGVVLAAIDEIRCKELMLSPMSAATSGSMDFSVSVEARQGVTTGISAADRATTLRTLATTTTPRSDLVTPGHIFPVCGLAGGVLVRAAVVEAAIDLMKLSENLPVATLCRCLDSDGSPITATALQELATTHDLPITSLTEVIYKRLSSETIVERIGVAKLPIRGIDEFNAISYRSKIDGAEHLVLVKGDLNELDKNKQQKPIYTRVQAEHRLNDLLGLEKLSSRTRLNRSLEKISEKGRGILVYIRHPHKGRLAKQIESIQESRNNPPTKAAQLREYGVGAQILKDLEAQRLILITNSDRVIPGIDAFNIEIVGREPLN